MENVKTRKSVGQTIKEFIATTKEFIATIKSVFEKIKLGDKIIEYTLYVGLNDKDTKKQEVSNEFALNTINRILLNEGITDKTVQNALGVYTHNNGTTTTENSLILTMFFVERIQLIRAIEKIKIVLNQESIILKEQKVKSELL